MPSRHSASATTSPKGPVPERPAKTTSAPSRAAAAITLKPPPAAMPAGGGQDVAAALGQRVHAQEQVDDDRPGEDEASVSHVVSSRASSPSTRGSRSSALTRRTVSSAVRGQAAAPVAPSTAPAIAAIVSVSPPREAARHRVSQAASGSGWAGSLPRPSRRPAPARRPPTPARRRRCRSPRRGRRPARAARLQEAGWPTPAVRRCRRRRPSVRGGRPRGRLRRRRPALPACRRRRCRR